MIKYNFLVEVGFLDKENDKKERVPNEIIKGVTEERLQQLNEAKVGRAISAFYIEEKTETKNKSNTRTNKKKETTEDKPAEEQEAKVEETENKEITEIQEEK